MTSTTTTALRRLPRGIALTAVAALIGGSVACAGPRDSAVQGPADHRIAVDLSDGLGPVTHGANGALYGLGNPGIPSNADLDPLIMQTVVQMAPDGVQHPDGDALKVGPQFFATGGKQVFVYAQDFYPDFPYDKVPIADYGDLLEEQMAKVAAAPDADKYAWVPFNEPDWIWYGTSGAKLAAFLKDWKTIYQRIRSVDDDAVIVGPAFERYNSDAYRAFLTFAKQNDVLPDILSWHELHADFLTNWYDNYDDYRAIEDEVGVEDLPININEYGQPAEMGVPGRMLQYLARFDATRVDACMASWWAGEWLGRTLNKQLQRTSGWYLFRWYGQASGTSVAVTPEFRNGSLQGVASFASGGKSARVVIGGADGRADVAVSGIPSTLGSSVRVRVWTLTSTGHKASKGPVLASTTTATVSKGSITVKVPTLSADDAALVQLG